MPLDIVFSHLCLQFGVLLGLGERSRCYFPSLCPYPHTLIDGFGVLHQRVIADGDIPELFGPLNCIDFLRNAAVLPLSIESVLNTGLDEL